MRCRQRKGLRPTDPQNNPAIQGHYTPLEKITANLEGVIHSQNGQIRAVCPSHESRNKSRTLAVKESDDGGVLLHCFADCSASEILAALGLELSDLYPEPPPSAPGRPFTKKAAFSPREALHILAFEITLTSAFISDVISKRPVPDSDWNRFLVARDRIAEVQREYAS